MVDKIIEDYNKFKNIPERQPLGWTAQTKYNTRTEMMEARKLEARPDPSYDLDGDGAVNNKDYFIAKHFDVDKDGKLNSKELETAKKAIADGFEHKFVFGLERAGLVDNIRD